MNVEIQIEREEGRKSRAYQDTLGKWTIGVGHTGPEVHKDLVWTDEQIDFHRNVDIQKAVEGCIAHLPFFPKLNEPRQAVLIGMVFQMGMNGVLGFKETLAAVRDEHWAHAAHQMLCSEWAKQTPKRAYRAARQMETGEWQ